MAIRCECETCQWLTDQAEEIGITESLDGYASACDYCPYDCAATLFSMSQSVQ